MADSTDPNQAPQNEGRPPINPNYTAPPPPPPPGYAPPYYAPPPAKASGGVISKVATSLIATVFITSIMANIYFVIILSQQVKLGPVVEQTYQDGEADKRIVILPVQGVINDESAAFIRQAVQSLEENPPKALVLRVNSGGGGVGASDRIWHYLDTFKRDHPDVKVVASFGSYAASGGYYVSALSDHIYAETTCITGSIGVMGQLFTVEGLLEKVGVQPITMVATESPNKDAANDITRNWTEQDKQVVQGLLDNAYERFLEVVVQGRADVLSEDEVRAIADGRVLTAQEALDAKLIDDIGYMDEAIAKAADLAGLNIDEVQVTVVGQKPTFMQALMGADAQLPSLNAEQVRSAITEMAVPRLSYTLQVP